MSPKKSSFRFALFNVENLFIYMDEVPQDLATMKERQWQQLSSSNTANKPLSKIFEIQQIIKEMDADLIGLVEVGGKESLENLNRYFLNDEYHCLLVEGNSDRGIDVGYLLKKSSSLKPMILTHKQRTLDLRYPSDTEPTTYYFSRDVAELRLFEPGEHTPSLVVLLTHLKSKLDQDNKDSQGCLRRGAEVNALTEIYNLVKDELGGKVPIITAGDFNGAAGSQNTEPEFDSIYSSTDLKDVFDIVGLSEDERITHIVFPQNGRPQSMQLDYIFVSPWLSNQVMTAQTKVVRFPEGGSLPLTATERDLLPSDHYPVVLELKGLFQK